MRVAKPIKDERKRIGTEAVVRKSTDDLFRIDISFFAGSANVRKFVEEKRKRLKVARI